MFSSLTSLLPGSPYHETYLTLRFWRSKSTGEWRLKGWDYWQPMSTRSTAKICNGIYRTEHKFTDKEQDKTYARLRYLNIPIILQKKSDINPIASIGWRDARKFSH